MEVAPVRLSILDQSPIRLGCTAREALQETARLVQAAESWGYHRFWVSEHHSTARLAGTTPEVLLAHLGAVTSRIRIGSGGVLLPYYSSMKVAENFRMLEALYPNRIDLGIGRAPGGDFRAMLALNRGAKRSLDEFPFQVRELLSFLHADGPTGHPTTKVYAMPYVPEVPPVWLLGSSDTSAKLAAELGTSFAFAQFINREGGIEAMRAYREGFKPSIHLDAPQAHVAVFVFCSDSDEELEKETAIMDLRFLWFEQGRTGETPSADQALSYKMEPWEKERVMLNRPRVIFGKPREVKERLAALANDYGVDEVMMVTITDTFEARLRSYELVAREFGLG